MLKESELFSYYRDQMNKSLTNISKQMPSDNELSPEQIAAKTTILKLIKATFLMTEEEQEDYTKHYVEHIAGVKVPEEWRRDRKWLDQVGMNLNGVGDKPPYDYDTFWNRVRDSIPELVSESDLPYVNIHFLLSPLPNFVFGMITFHPKTALPNEVGISIHAWK